GSDRISSQFIPAAQPFQNIVSEHRSEKAVRFLPAFGGEKTAVCIKVPFSSDLAIALFFMLTQSQRKVNEKHDGTALNFQS
ncbi:MAG: hypothetical protein ACLSWS_17735, partial [Faecalispora jeddahensis]